MKIVADENIYSANKAFEQFGSVVLLPGRQIKAEHLKDADVLFVRSVTKVNEDLLKGSSVKFVGTATIGTDHVDKEYLKSRNIGFSDAAGCNARAVAEYVFTAISKLADEKNIKFRNLTLGIVGAGHIGSKVAKLGKAAGMRVLLNDPPLARKNGKGGFVDLDKIMDADIITLHVPLNREGIDKTVHLFDYKRILKLKNNSIFINASRGQVVNNLSLLKLIEEKQLTVVLDVWENEPNINTGLLKKVRIGTPHIAGYSLEGKYNGTVMMVDALCEFLGIENKWPAALPGVEDNVIKVGNSTTIEKAFAEVFSNVYDIEADDSRMREIIRLPEEKYGSRFDKLRKNYPFRREFKNYAVKLNDYGFAEYFRSFDFSIK